MPIIVPAPHKHGTNAQPFVTLLLYVARSYRLVYAGSLQEPDLSPTFLSSRRIKSEVAQFITLRLTLCKVSVEKQVQQNG
jgi:hypothetical protein